MSKLECSGFIYLASLKALVMLEQVRILNRGRVITGLAQTLVIFCLVDTQHGNTCDGDGVGALYNKALF